MIVHGFDNKLLIITLWDTLSPFIEQGLILYILMICCGRQDKRFKLAIKKPFTCTVQTKYALQKFTPLVHPY